MIAYMIHAGSQVTASKVQYVVCSKCSDLHHQMMMVWMMHTSTNRIPLPDSTVLEEVPGTGK